MGLVNSKEVAKAINVDKFGVFGTFLGWSLMKILNISTINKIYDRNKHLSDLDFINALLDEFEINFEIPESEQYLSGNITDNRVLRLSILRDALVLNKTLPDGLFSSNESIYSSCSFLRISNC